MVDIGETAPDFGLINSAGEMVHLKDLLGGLIVLYFYPKDDTSGCTAQALDFTAARDAFKASGATVIGVSPDSVKSHVKFTDKHDLTIMLLSDEDKQTVGDYGVWVEKSMYGRKYMGVERSTFLIGADGKILNAWRKVKVKGHVAIVLDAVKNAQS